MTVPNAMPDPVTPAVAPDDSDFFTGSSDFVPINALITLGP